MRIERNSSFELLRIILMLMILIEHCNMWFIGSGYQSESEHIAKCIVESICIGSVNTFVLISGWFGIKNGIKKIGGLIFALLFTTVPILVVAMAAGVVPLTALNSLEAIYNYVFGGIGYWFIVAYIGLVIISPILNSAIDTMSRKLYRNILIAFYVLTLIYDFALKSSDLGIEGGYSATWFVYLYLLAAYIRRYGMSSMDKHPWVILVGSIVIQSYLFINGFIGLRYTNPFILIESICLILIFRRYNFYNKTINYVAKGCVMAYLLHVQPIFIEYIRAFLAKEYNALGYWTYMAEVIVLSIIVLVLAFFVNEIQSSIYKKLRISL